MDSASNTVPVCNETCSAEDRFNMTYHLLSRWQTELEFFLYQFCKTVAPELVNDCHWSCAEAAELTRLSEKVTVFFCFNHKTIFKDCGISEQERESFCSELQEIRQIRHFAVHRVKVNAITINKYAKCALNVLGTVRRLGGQGFGKDYGEALDRFVNSFWETEGHPASQTSSHTYPSQDKEHQSYHNSREELKKVHTQQMIEAQTSAATKKSENIIKMTEDFERAKAEKSIHLEQNYQNRELAVIAREKRLNIAREEAEGARLRKAKRAEHSQKQQGDAQVKKIERAEHNEKQQDNAQLQKQEGDAQHKQVERAEHNEKQQGNAQPKKVEKAKQSQKQQGEAQPKNPIRAKRSQNQQDDAQPNKVEKAKHCHNQQDHAHPKKFDKAKHSQNKPGEAQIKKTTMAKRSQNQQGQAKVKS